MITPHAAFTAAERVAPQPTSGDATADDWARHYAALALAAYTAFGDSSGTDLGYLSSIGTTATAAAVALTKHRRDAAGLLWDLTPELGALNGEWEEWLAETLDELGVNPADINPRYAAGDFRSPVASATRES